MHRTDSKKDYVKFSSHTVNPDVELIKDGDLEVVYIIRSTTTTDKTKFFTSKEATLQAGLVYRSAGTKIPRHKHRGGKRILHTTAEVLFVRSGHCEIEIYSDSKQYLGTKELFPGDTVVILRGGHGFKMIKDTTFFEIKQGPFLGVSEKEGF